MRLKAKLKAATVKKFLVVRNLPQKWLSSQVGTSTGYLCQLMNGSRHPSPAMRKKLMDIMEIRNFSDLFSITK